MVVRRQRVKCLNIGVIARQPLFGRSVVFNNSRPSFHNIHLAPVQSDCQGNVDVFQHTASRWRVHCVASLTGSTESRLDFFSHDTYADAKDDFYIQCG